MGLGLGLGLVLELGSGLGFTSEGRLSSLPIFQMVMAGCLSRCSWLRSDRPTWDAWVHSLGYVELLSGVHGFTAWGA